eukprot:jgi/Tetstr1/427813/TSEL_001785.t1
MHVRLKRFERRLGDEIFSIPNGADLGVVEVRGVAAKVSTNDGVGRLSSELQALRGVTFRSYASKLSQFAEFCHDSENISPLEATTATIYDFRAFMASVVDFVFVAGGLPGVSRRVRDMRADAYNITLQVCREKGRAGRRDPDDLCVPLLPVSEHPRIARLLHHFINNVKSASKDLAALVETNF